MADAFVESSFAFVNGFRTALTNRGCYSLDDELMAEEWITVNKALLDSFDPRDRATKGRKRYERRAEELMSLMCDRVAEAERSDGQADG